MREIKFFFSLYADDFLIKKKKNKIIKCEEKRNYKLFVLTQPIQFFSL